jgi:hypothetical protein
MSAAPAEKQKTQTNTGTGTTAGAVNEEERNSASYVVSNTGATHSVLCKAT